jgi:hypothetical protein
VGDDRIGQAAEQAARADRFIVRVRYDHESRRQSLLEGGSLRDPVEYLAGDLAWGAIPGIAIGCDHEIRWLYQAARSFLLGRGLLESRDQEKVSFAFLVVKRWYEPQLAAIHERYL